MGLMGPFVEGGMNLCPGYQGFEAQWLWVYKREAQAHPNTEEFFAHRSVLNIYFPFLT
jgi:hypothetical protein